MWSLAYIEIALITRQPVPSPPPLY